MAEPDSPTDLDPLTARLARDWFADAHARTKAETAANEAKTRPSVGDDAGNGLFDRLFGAFDADDVIGDGTD